MSVHEVTKAIQEKVGVGGKDHGIFQPIENDPTQMGRWLKPDKSLEYYDLKANVHFHAKKSSTNF